MMRFAKWIGTSMVLVLALSVTGIAQTDHFGKIDTIYAELQRISDMNWSITISMTNDEAIEGLSIPLKMTAGVNRIVADSALYTGGRVEHFTLKAFRPDTAIQCLTLGMVANLGPTAHQLDAGSGRLVTIFVSSLDKKPIEKLVVDTTTTHPNNSLMAVAHKSNWGEYQLDTISLETRKELEIYPAFKVLYVK